MQWEPVMLAQVLLLVASCGRTPLDPAPLSAAGGEGGQASEVVTPDPDQAFAFGVAAPRQGEGASVAYACTTQGAIELGPSAQPTGRLSPDGLHWAVARDDGVDVIEAPSLASKRLAGHNVQLQTLRWSDDGGRLAYFADGFPMLADGDGDGGRPLAVTLPDPDDEIELPFVEWTKSGERVGFLARGVALTARRDGSDPHALFRGAARVTIPRGLAFSQDGRTAAVVDDSSRSLVLVDVSSLQVTRTDVVETATIQAWAIGDGWLVVSTSRSPALLVSITGRSRVLAGSAAASPTYPELAVSDAGVQLLQLDGGAPRELIASDLDTGPLFYRDDGQAIQYLAASQVRVVDRESGALLAENAGWGAFGPGGWFAVAAPGQLRLTNLSQPAQSVVVPSSLPLKLSEGGGAWLKDDRFALADDRGVHLVWRDGAIASVCPDVTRVDAFQVPRANAY